MYGWKQRVRWDPAFQWQSTAEMDWGVSLIENLKELSKETNVFKKERFFYARKINTFFLFGSEL